MRRGELGKQLRMQNVNVGVICDAVPDRGLLAAELGILDLRKNGQSGARRFGFEEANRNPIAVPKPIAQVAMPGSPD